MHFLLCAWDPSDKAYNCKVSISCNASFYTNFNTSFISSLV